MAHLAAAKRLNQIAVASQALSKKKGESRIVRGEIEGSFVMGEEDQ